MEISVFQSTEFSIKVLTEIICAFSGSQRDGGGGSTSAKARVIHIAAGEGDTVLQGAARKCPCSDEGGAGGKGSHEQVILS